jgi:hypothetical protein
MATGTPALNWERFATQEVEVLSRTGVFVAGRVTGGLIGLKGQVSLAAQRAGPHPGARPPLSVCLLFAVCDVYQIGPGASG